MINVVYDKQTKEVMAVVGDIKDYIVRNDIEVKTYIDTEPIFANIDGKMYVKENAIQIKGVWEE